MSSLWNAIVYLITFRWVGSSAVSNTLAQVAVQTVAGNWFVKDPAMASKALGIINTVSAAMSTGQVTSLTAFDALVQAEITKAFPPVPNPNPSPANPTLPNPDLPAINAIIGQIQSQVLNTAATQIMPVSGQLGLATTILGWIQQTATIYAPK